MNTIYNGTPDSRLYKEVLGKTIGARIVSKLNLDLMKKIIYIFMGLSGLLTFVTNL